MPNFSVIRAAKSCENLNSKFSVFHNWNIASFIDCQGALMSSYISITKWHCCLQTLSRFFLGTSFALFVCLLVCCNCLSVAFICLLRGVVCFAWVGQSCLDKVVTIKSNYCDTENSTSCLATWIVCASHHKELLIELTYKQLQQTANKPNRTNKQTKTQALVAIVTSSSACRYKTSWLFWLKGLDPFRKYITQKVIKSWMSLTTNKQRKQVKTGLLSW